MLAVSNVAIVFFGTLAALPAACGSEHKDLL